MVRRSEGGKWIAEFLQNCTRVTFAESLPLVALRCVYEQSGCLTLFPDRYVLTQRSPFSSSPNSEYVLIVGKLEAL
jgi:hypothetical protein